MSNTQPAPPRFALHQAVSVIANQGGLYAAQIGVVGIISKQRTKRRYGFRFYDVTYHDAKGREKVVIVREDDLEVARAAYVIDGDCIVDALGGVVYEGLLNPKSCNFTPVEAQTLLDLLNEGHDHLSWEEIEPLVAERVRVTTDPREMAPVLPTKPTKASETPPLFSVGELVTVDRHSALAYEAFTRGGAVGVIVGVGTPVRGIRRYDVRYAADTPAARRAVARDRLGLLPLAQIREEHLLPAPAPDQASAQNVHDTQTVIIQRNDGAVEVGEVRSASVVIAEHADGTVTFACARGRGSVTCDHTWQVWPDGRYRHCPKCKLSERVMVAVTGNSEVAR